MLFDVRHRRHDVIISTKLLQKIWTKKVKFTFSEIILKYTWCTVNTHLHYKLLEIIDGETFLSCEILLNLIKIGFQRILLVIPAQPEILFSEKLLCWLCYNRAEFWGSIYINLKNLWSGRIRTYLRSIFIQIIPKEATKT